MLQRLYLVCLNLPLVLFFFLNKISSSTSTNHAKAKASSSLTLPKSYPLLGPLFSILANRNNHLQWLSDVVLLSPKATFTLQLPFYLPHVITANPSVVQHILHTHFHNYPKGDSFSQIFKDFFGNGIFNSDGSQWEFQRHILSPEFNTRSLCNFIENVVDIEISNRLLPILSVASLENQVLDLQDIIQRFTFDNICKVAFGFDPSYLSPSLTQSKFAVAFEDCVQISEQRSTYIVPMFWKIKKLCNIGSEKRLRKSISEVRDFAKDIIRQKKRELNHKKTIDSAELLSRLLKSGHSDEDFVIDMVISFFLAGRDTTSAALTWFFWLLSKNPRVENAILQEVNAKSELLVYDQIKQMVYTHAALCETMRLYPPAAMDTKETRNDDVLPDGTAVKKGTRVSYHVYGMGRSAEIWGSDWAEFRPERWLEKFPSDTNASPRWRFVARDSFSYPVFQAGPRICLGKDMAFMQMKRVVAGILRRFRVVPAMEDAAEPQYIAHLTSRMKGGFPVKVEERV